MPEIGDVIDVLFAAWGLRRGGGAGAYVLWRKLFVRAGAASGDGLGAGLSSPVARCGGGTGPWILLSVLACPLRGGGAGADFLALPKGSLFGSCGCDVAESPAWCGSASPSVPPCEELGRREFPDASLGLAWSVIDFPWRELGGGGGAFFLCPNCTAVLESDASPSSSVFWSRCSPDDTLAPPWAPSTPVTPGPAVPSWLATPLLPLPVLPVISSLRNESTFIEPLALAALSAAPSSLRSSFSSCSFFEFSRSCSVLLNGLGGGPPPGVYSSSCCCCWCCCWWWCCCCCCNVSGGGVPRLAPKASPTPLLKGSLGNAVVAAGTGLDGHSGESGDRGGGESTRTFLTTLAFFPGAGGTAAGASETSPSSPTWPSSFGPRRKLTGGGGRGAWATDVSMSSTAGKRAASGGAGPFLRKGLEDDMAEDAGMRGFDGEVPDGMYEVGIYPYVQGMEGQRPRAIIDRGGTSTSEGWMVRGWKAGGGISRARGAGLNGKKRRSRGVGCNGWKKVCGVWW